jgi:hypothetical protein
VTIRFFILRRENWTRSTSKPQLTWIRILCKTTRSKETSSTLITRDTWAQKTQQYRQY